MGLRFCEHDDVVFRKAPLLLVLTQIRFQPIYALLSEAGIVGFQEFIRNAYPHVSQEFSAEIELGKETKVSQQVPIWRFQDEKEDGWKWRVGLAVDFVALETTAYLDFDDFAEKLSLVLLAVEKTLAPSSSVRVGLRKVNDFAHPSAATPVDWTKLLNERLVGLAGVSGLPGKISFSFNDVRFEDDDNILAIRHGISPDDAANYRLDLDYFTERPYEVRPQSALTELLREFSNSMTSFFHWCLTDTLNSYLEPRPRETARRA